MPAVKVRLADEVQCQRVVGGRGRSWEVVGGRGRSWVLYQWWMRCAYPLYYFFSTRNNASITTAQPKSQMLSTVLHLHRLPSVVVTP